MALVTTGSELRGRVIWVGRALEVRRMAGVALRGHCLERASGRTFVTRIAVHGGVRSGQRKAVVVLLHLLNRYRPPPHRVALLAVGAELSLVNVGVAILAALPHIREYGLDVALSASHRLMHAAKRIASLIVIELRNRPNRFPALGRVAVLTRDGEIAVWTVSTSILLGGLQGSRNSRERQHQCDYQIEPAPQ